MKLSLGFSPCPNDTFIFDALIHHKVDTEGLEFEVQLGDVEWLNKKAFRHELDITKLSYHAYLYLVEPYILLTSGSALGNNCGPLLIAKENLELERLLKAPIAIPGQYTTANFLLSARLPQATNKIEVLFSDIEKKILDGSVRAGLIIHENRFTYHERGLTKLIDLGEWWEKTIQLPIPLGGIVAKRGLPANVLQKINRVLKRSIQFAFDNPNSSLEYSLSHAQEMDTQVMQRHIQLYVNQYSLDFGKKGKAAIEQMFLKNIPQKATKASLPPLFIS